LGQSLNFLEGQSSKSEKRAFFNAHPYGNLLVLVL
jgi:hypothetical protein